MDAFSGVVRERSLKLQPEAFFRAFMIESIPQYFFATFIKSGAASRRVIAVSAVSHEVMIPFSAAQANTSVRLGAAATDMLADDVTMIASTRSERWIIGEK
jgi:hypothetical protein